MPPSPDTLHGFAYGEHLDESQRSLGYRLLAPAAPETWCGEIETLARLLQGVPYPDSWPPVELFCSVLLADGRRLVAVVRYGLADHTASKRRGGLELIGVVGPRDLDPQAAVAVYRWLRQRRTAAEDLRSLGGQHSLGEIRAAISAEAQPEAVALLPIRAWQPGILLFVASSPSAPDKALSLLHQAPAATWQWLPLCGGDFPLETYGQRGPLVAWTPHLLEVAVRLDRPSTTVPPQPARRARGIATALAVVLLLLLGANLWAIWSLPSRLDSARPAPPAEKSPTTGQSKQQPASGSTDHDSREKLALALHHLLRDEGGAAELDRAENDLVARYNRLAARSSDLRVDSRKGQAAIGLVDLLAQRSADKVGLLIENEFKAKQGYDPAFIKLVSQRVRERLTAEANKAPGD